jgi:hypothetical protein
MWKKIQIPEPDINKIKRDMIILQLYYPLLKETFEETLEQFAGSNLDKTKATLLLILKLYSLRTRAIKAIAFGHNTNDLMETYKVLAEKNVSSGISFSIPGSVMQRQTSHRDYDSLYLRVNYDVLRRINGDEYNVWSNFQGIELQTFMLDPAISRNIKKRVFMSAISSGQIANIESWTEKIGVIMHNWNIRQTYIESTKKWHGNFELCLFQGGKQLICRYLQHRDKYYIGKYRMNDPEALYSFFQEITEILNITLEELISKLEEGNWILKDSRIIQFLGAGFKITEMMSPAHMDFSGCNMSVTDEWTTLLDTEGKKIYSIKTGLIHTTGRIDLPNFEIFGIMWEDILSINAFSQNFNVSYKSRKDTLQCLRDLEVPKPKITTITQNRLGLKENWDIYQWQEEKEEEIEVSVIDTTSVYSRMMMEDISFLEQLDLSFGPLDDFLSCFMGTDLLSTMETTREVMQTRKIFNNIKNLKYDLICHQVLLEMRISRRTIGSISAIIHPRNVNITYSMISLYDRTYHTTDLISPDGAYMNLSSEFMTKFNLYLTDISEVLD